MILPIGSYFMIVFNSLLEVSLLIILFCREANKAVKIIISTCYPRKMPDQHFIIADRTINNLQSLTEKRIKTMILFHIVPRVMVQT